MLLPPASSAAALAAVPGAALALQVPAAGALKENTSVVTMQMSPHPVPRPPPGLDEQPDPPVKQPAQTGHGRTETRAAQLVADAPN